jgi:hypothetical protein
MCCVDKVRKSRRDSAPTSVSIEYIPRNIDTILYPQAQESFQQQLSAINLNNTDLNRLPSQASLPPSYPEIMKRSKINNA